MRIQRKEPQNLKKEELKLNLRFKKNQTQSKVRYYLKEDFLIHYAQYFEKLKKEVKN
jgi:hypothetical protein